MTRVLRRTARSRRHAALWSVVASLTVAAAVVIYAAAPGDLDTTFNNTGKVTLDFGGNLDDQAHGVKLYAGPTQTGKLIVTGAVNGSNAAESSNFGLMRLNGNGTPDSQFGGGTGKVITDFNGLNDWAYAVEIQSDEKVVAAGCASRNTGNQFNPRATDFALARYNAADGSPDGSFKGGKLTTVFTGVDSCALAVLQQPDGKLVAAGYAGSSFALVRYLPSGDLDATFGSGGKVTTSFGTGPAGAYAIVYQPPSGSIPFKLIVAGSTNRTIEGAAQDFALARYDQSGNLDPSFDGDGKVTTDLNFGNDHAFALVLQPDQKLVAAGYREEGPGTRDFALARYNPAGGLDTAGFGSGTGWVTTDFGGGDDAAYSLLFQPDGMLVAAGFGRPGGTSSFALARYLTGGGLDPAFGSNGKLTTPAGTFGGAFSVLRQPADGKLVAAGMALGASFDFAVNRYIGEPTSGNTPPSFAPVQANPSSIYEGGQISLSGTFTDPDSADTFTLQINWGDGTVSPPPITIPVGVRFLPQVPHTYVNNPTGVVSGTFTITLTLTDNFGGSVTTSTPVTVSNFPPALQASVDKTTVGVGEAVTLTATVGSDPGTSDPHVVTIEWGDGAQDVVSLTPGETGPITKPHSYANAGAFTISATVFDDVEQTSIGAITVNVIAAPPPAPPAAPSNPAATAVSTTEIDVSWTDNANNETGTEIERCTTKGKVTCLTFQVGSDVQHFLDAGLTKAKTYQYRVRAFNAVGPSAWVGPVSATTLKR